MPTHEQGRHAPAHRPRSHRSEIPPAIPRRVAPQQGPLPLRRTNAYKSPFQTVAIPRRSICPLIVVSHTKGAVHNHVPPNRSAILPRSVRRNLPEEKQTTLGRMGCCPSDCGVRDAITPESAQPSTTEAGLIARNASSAVVELFSSAKKWIAATSAMSADRIFATSTLTFTSHLNEIFCPPVTARLLPRSSNSNSNRPSFLG